MPNPRVSITYCTQCNWLLRASWYAGELLTTFAAEVGEVALVPATGGVFRVDARTDDPTGVTHTLWNRKTDGGFPDVTELKRRVRDVIAPDKHLGHADRAAAAATTAAAAPPGPA